MAQMILTQQLSDEHLCFYAGQAMGYRTALFQYEPGCYGDKRYAFAPPECLYVTNTEPGSPHHIWARYDPLGDKNLLWEIIERFALDVEFKSLYVSGNSLPEESGGPVRLWHCYHTDIPKAVLICAIRCWCNNDRVPALPISHDYPCMPSDPAKTKIGINEVYLKNGKWYA